ncbi:O-acyltransferase [Bacteroidia bacterium]|nr:O-acyltransferase [Bacteroidia bacterium]
MIASYVFYGWWDWRFLPLIAISSFSDFFIGDKISNLNVQKKTAPDDALAMLDRKRKRWLIISIVINLGVLGFFKYFNFFVDSFVDLLSTLGFSASPITLNIILPVGISFYTFQTMSYTIDIYRKQELSSKNWVQFFAFVSFFPQLMAGPIERAKNLLPQFETLKKPDYQTFRSAMLLIAWGFFKKIMIADRLAVYVDTSFGNIPGASGFPIMLGIMFFSFQVYCDFSGYSNIAIGTARLFGFELRKNFNRPYLGTSFANFWRRWHISLTSWLTDYVFTPTVIRFRDLGKWGVSFAVLITFALSGLWHGAGWTFVMWGVINGLCIVLFDPLLSLSKSKNAVSHTLKSLFVWGGYTFSLIFFRAENFDAVMNCFRYMDFSNFGAIINYGLNVAELKFSILLIVVVLVKEIIWEKDDTVVQRWFYKLPAIVRWIFYSIFVLSMVYFGQYGNGTEHSFIYFQF